MRKVFVALGAVVVVCVVAIAGLLLYVRSAEPDYGRDGVLPGLGASVEVWRDSLAVPHLWAESDLDLYAAQGYVHAQDRLWQMEMFRRVAQGRLSELFGERTVSADRFLRTIGLWRAAGASEQRLAPADRRRLEAYAAGVNAWIAGHPGALPPEFLALRFEPEPWTVRHSLAIEKVMAWDLASYATGVALANAWNRLGEEKARHLAPTDPEWGVTIMGDVPAPPPIPDIAAAALDRVSITRASNAWVIGGEHTRSGKPILANDMHLGFDAPAIWYLMALHAAAAEGRPIDVVGMTLPGTPGVVAGHNRAVAWGFTNASVDDVDFFIERVDPADTTRYLTPDGSRPFEVFEDTIRVRGREPVPIAFRWTRHGPILSDAGVWVGPGPVAMRWAAHEPSGTIAAIIGFNRARDWEEFTAAVERFDNPHQNVVYADTAGRIGYWMGGTVPLRGSSALDRIGRPDGPKRPPLLPVPGWSGQWDWVGALPFSLHPHLVDPERGFIVTANNRQARGDTADLVASEWASPYRAQRISAMIREGGPFDADAVHRQQLDVYDALAARYRDRAVEAAESAGLDAAAALLADWDLEADLESRGAALFYVWFERLQWFARHDLWGQDRGYMPPSTVEDILERRALPWVDPGGDSAYLALAARAIAAADSIAGGRPWGEMQWVRIDHALGSVAALERVLGFNVGPAPVMGSPNTPNVAHRSSGWPGRVTAGVSQRHVVDMGDIDGSGGFIIPTGQSGIPTSPHYRDQFERWRTGGLWRIPLDRASAEARVVHRMILRPSQGM